MFESLDKIRRSIAVDLTLIMDKDLPEVTGYRIARSPVMQQAVALHNQAKYEEGLAEELARLGVSINPAPQALV